MNLRQVIAYIPIIFTATLVTFILHEMAHWVAYEILGYRAGFRLNFANVKNPAVQLSNAEKIITSFSGPLFTIIQAFICFFLLRIRNQIFLYPFLFVPFVMRLGAAWANQFSPNDEGRISLILGLNLYTISVIVVLIHFVLIYMIARKNSYSLKINILTFLISLIAIILIVYLDHIYRFQIV